MTKYQELCELDIEFKAKHERWRESLLEEAEALRDMLVEKINPPNPDYCQLLQSSEGNPLDLNNRDESIDYKNGFLPFCIKIILPEGKWKSLIKVRFENNISTFSFNYSHSDERFSKEDMVEKIIKRFVNIMSYDPFSGEKMDRFISEFLLDKYQNDDES